MKSSQYIQTINSIILTLQKYSPKETLDRQFQSNGAIENLSKLKVQQLGIDYSKLMKSGIGYRNILIKKGLRITLYFLPAGEEIKLHNHPSMLVVSHILKGKLQATYYSPTVTPCVFNKETLILTQNCTSYIDGLRTNNKNLHELKAIEDTYFIDILYPDYDAKRDCTFFQEDEKIGENCYRLKPILLQQIQFFSI